MLCKKNNLIFISFLVVTVGLSSALQATPLDFAKGFATETAQSAIAFTTGSIAYHATFAILNLLLDLGIPKDYLLSTEKLYVEQREYADGTTDTKNVYAPNNYAYAAALSMTALGALGGFLLFNHIQSHYPIQVTSKNSFLEGYKTSILLRIGALAAWLVMRHKDMLMNKVNDIFKKSRPRKAAKRVPLSAPHSSI